jgi:hypothetical protein
MCIFISVLNYTNTARYVLSWSNSVYFTHPFSSKNWRKICCVFNMKYCLLLLLLFPSILGKAQDTTQLVKYFDKTKTFWLVSEKDTMMYSYYPNGKKESERKYNFNGKTIVYKRWYENGKLMWERETVNDIAHGKTVFYDAKGIRMAELNFENGMVSDTVFIKKGTHLVLGKITSRSVVYGGMQREDGSSNVSDYTAPWMYNSMYAAKVDSLKKPELIQYFRSDHKGEFFILAPEGTVGYFPKATPIEKLNPGEFYPVGREHSSVHEGWSIRGAQLIRKEDLLLIVEIHHESVGYAP